MATTQSSSRSKAYLAVLGASLALFCSVGFLNAFGVFQQYYQATMLHDRSESDISWIGSTLIFLLYALAPAAGILVDRIGPTKLLFLGSMGHICSIFMTSLCTEYYQFFLAQAVLQGSSMAFVTWPPLAVVSRHMPHNRGIALGLVFGGSSIGGIIWPIALDQFLNHTNLGFAWTMRIVGFMMLPLLAISCFTVVERASAHSSDDELPDTEREQEVVERKPQHSSWSIARNKAFLLLCLGLAVAFLGIFTPTFYVSTYATSKGIAADTSFYLISLINASSLFGRIIPGLLADRYGHFNLCLLSMLASGVIAFCWPAATTLGGLLIWSLAYGFTTGAVISLQSACAGKIATVQTQGTAMGLLIGAVALTSLVGSPIGGELVSHSGFTSLAIFTGATLIGGSALFAFARLLLDSKVFSVV